MYFVGREVNTITEQWTVEYIGMQLHTGNSNIFNYFLRRMSLENIVERAIG